MTKPIPKRPPIKSIEDEIAFWKGEAGVTKSDAWMMMLGISFGLSIARDKWMREGAEVAHMTAPTKLAELVERLNARAASAQTVFSEYDSQLMMEAAAFLAAQDELLRRAGGVIDAAEAVADGCAFDGPGLTTALKAAIRKYRETESG